MKSNIGLVIISLMILMVAGCAQDGTLVSKPVTKAEKTAVKVGILLPQTGDLATLGEDMVQAAELAAKHINEKGGVNGLPLELVIEDSQCLPQPTVSAMNKLTSVDKVDGVVGAACSSATLAAAPIAEQTQTVLLSPASTSPLVTDAGDYVFRVVTSDSYQGVEGAKLIEELGFSEVAILYINNDYGIGLRDVVSENVEANGGTVLGKESFEPNLADYRTELTKVKSKNPEVVYVVGYPAEGGVLFKQMKELGLDAEVVGSEGFNDPTIIDVAGAEATEGIIVTIPATNTDEKYTEFTAAYDLEFGEDAGIYTSETYDAVMLLADAIATGNAKDGLVSIGTYSGAAGTITFDENGDVVKPYDKVVFKGGEIVPYNG